MPFVSFHSRFPQLAERETRTLTVLGPTEFGLPAGDYSFLELFCDEPGCDCRRVLFSVVSSVREDVEAVVTWGWEPLEFYRQWMGDDDEELIAEIKGPGLNLCSPQSRLAPGILAATEDLLLQDDAYVERVKQHYALFRGTVDHAPRKRSWTAARVERKRRRRFRAAKSGTRLPHL